jgi:hypothetical protein
MFVLEPKEDSFFRVRTVVPEGSKFLGERFAKFGPQEVPLEKEFPSGGLV